MYIFKNIFFGTLLTIVNIVLGRAILAVINMLGYYPEEWLARVMVNIAPSLMTENAIWVASGLLALVFYLIELKYKLLQRLASYSVSEAKERPSGSVKYTDFDVWLYDAIYYIAFGCWDRSEIDRSLTEESRLKQLYSASNEIIQSAREGELVIGGKEGQTGTVNPIQEGYWGQFGIKGEGLLGDEPADLHTEVKVIGYKGFVYRNLRTNKAKVEELWPSANTSA
ncbi:MAG: hypothetical protein AB2598_20340 [Candidatus Thiodiazotropha sp.]